MSQVQIGVFFFFQAEDGIRDLTVTGVQTCALPILDAVTWKDYETDLDARLRDVHSRVHAGTYRAQPDRKSTRLNSSHSQISYAVFCLKKKKTNQYQVHPHAHSTRKQYDLCRIT